MTTRHIVPPTDSTEPQHTLSQECNCLPTVLEVEDVTRVIHHRLDGKPAEPIPKPVPVGYDPDRNFEGGRHGH